MFPPSERFDLDVEALSGICGSISIACWVVVFSPQLIENYRASSAKALSMTFLVIWLLGDVFNIIGAVLQGVLPTMIILAVYYTLADLLLIVQCLYYRGSLKTDKAVLESDDADEHSPLLPNEHQNGNVVPPQDDQRDGLGRAQSQSSFRQRLTGAGGEHLSPATPIHGQKDATDASVLQPSQPRSTTQTFFFNGTAIVVVILAGIGGYYLSPSSPTHKHTSTTPADEQAEALQFSFWGQVFGYICAVLYLASRIPQIMLNYRRRSTEGLNALFFIFACLGNLTYVFSIFAFSPICAKYLAGHWHEAGECIEGQAAAIYWRNILVNLSWIIGSAGTLGLDFTVFVQFFLYRENAPVEEEVVDEQHSIS